nr:hypothetical protein [Streptomyces sparsogenes]
MVDLHDEVDRVAALLAAEAIAGENVVLKDEGMPLVDCGAEYFFNSVSRLNGFDDPPPARESLHGRLETATVLRVEEEIGRQVLVDEMDTVKGARFPARKPFTDLLCDPICPDAETRAYRANVLQGLSLSTVQTDRAFLVHMPVGRQVTRQPPVEVRHRLVERGKILEEPWQMVHLDLLAGVRSLAIRKPFQQLNILDRVELRHGAGTAEGAVAIGDPMRDTEW